MLKIKLEVELKFKAKDIPALFDKLKNLNPTVMYIKDEIYGTGKLREETTKIRKRIMCTNKGVKIKLRRTTPVSSSVKKIIEEEVKIIPKKFVCESSYEKVRYFYKLLDGTEITVDFYPIGVYCEIEGNLNDIKRIAKKLGFDVKDNIKKNIDNLYEDWCKANHRKFLYHSGFGKI